MQTKLILVTPKLVAQWLETNFNNRSLSRVYVEELARALRSGEFRTTHQCIAFDRQDRLRDGQHRLTAIVQTGVAVEMLVSTGLTEAELQVIDDGRKRTAQKVLSMVGDGPASPFVTAMTRELLIGEHHFLNGAKRRKPTRLDLIECFLRHREALEFAEQCFRSPGTGLQVGYIAAVIARAYYSVDRNRLERFAKVLATGYAKEGDDPIIRLRNFIQRNRRQSQRGIALRDDIYAKTGRTLRDWMDGVQSKILTGTKEELFPLPEETLPAIHAQVSGRSGRGPDVPPKAGLKTEESI